MQKTIRLVKQFPQLDKRLRVAAYARVSTGKDAMLHSLSAQISYYNNLIQNNSSWFYVGVYSDEAKTGTKENRQGFQNLINDCRAGKIDMVITKSISRFARNTVVLLQIVRELKALGVDVFFEEQNIHTLSGDGELMMTILASYAQEESRSSSENQKWRVKRNFENGQPWRGAMLGYELVNGRYEVVVSEAQIVRRIYAEYLAGYGYNVIAKRLNADGIPSPTNKVWKAPALEKILANYNYTGNLILQKTYKENHITKKRMVNRGELPKYHCENSHEAIIDLDTFLAVQAEKEKRAQHYSKNPSPASGYPYTGLLICANCGKNYRRKVTSSGVTWICATYNTLGKSACASKRIPEDVLDEVIKEALNITEITAENIKNKVKSISVCNDNMLILHFTDGQNKTVRWQDKSRSQSWTAEMKENARQRALERRK